MKKVVIFDFDGVIANSAPFYFKRYRNTAEMFHKPFNINTLDEFRDWYDSKFEDNYRHLGFSEEEIGQVIQKVRKVKNYDEIPIFEGVREMFEQLRPDYKLLIASCTAGDVIRDKLEKEDLLKYIDYISSGEGKGSNKVAIITEALEMGGNSKSNSVMVGDTAMDLICAMEVGLTPIASTYGWYSRARLEKTGCKLFANSPLELPNLINSIFYEAIAV